MLVTTILPLVMGTLWLVSLLITFTCLYPLAERAMVNLLPSLVKRGASSSSSQPPGAVMTRLSWQSAATTVGLVGGNQQRDNDQYNTHCYIKVGVWTYSDLRVPRRH